MLQWELFLSAVNNGETMAAIEGDTDTYCVQKRIEKFRLRNCEAPELKHY